MTAGPLIVLLALSNATPAQEWTSYSGDVGGTRYSPLKQIDRQNVKNLRRAWTYHMGEVDRGGNATDRHHIVPFESTPLVVDGVLYFSPPSNRVVALDAERGQEIWQFDPQAGRGGQRQNRPPVWSQRRPAHGDVAGAPGVDGRPFARCDEARVHVKVPHPAWVRVWGGAKSECRVELNVA